MSDTTADSPRKAVAKHYLLDTQGQVTEDEKQATGIRYHHLASGNTFDYQISDAAKMMLAVFGAKTLATNEASAIRQKEGDDSDQVGAIRERFALLDSGEWVDRTREGGPKIDVPRLAASAAALMHGKGKLAQLDEAAAYAHILQALEEDPKKVQTFRDVPEIMAEYRKRAGKPVKTAADLADLI